MRRSLSLSSSKKEIPTETLASIFSGVLVSGWCGIFPMDSELPPNDDLLNSSVYSHDHDFVRSSRVFDRYFDSSSSSGGDDDDDNEDSRPSDSLLANKRLDNMIQFLDRKLSTSSNTNGDSVHQFALPEFVAKGGGTGIFKLPPRAAIHPHRPPSLELRPHPLRETQVGCLLRTIVTSSTQLWAGAENGVRVWEFRDLYRGSGADEGEESTPTFRESVTGVTASICMVADEGSRVVWTGHRDGTIKCWKMNLGTSSDQFGELFSWPAHRGPVLSIVITAYGMYVSSSIS